MRCGERVARIEHTGAAVSGVLLEGGARIAADLVISNADVLRTTEPALQQSAWFRTREAPRAIDELVGWGARFHEPTVALGRSRTRRMRPGNARTALPFT